jgi:quinol monooxygenase YgiN
VPDSTSTPASQPDEDRAARAVRILIWFRAQADDDVHAIRKGYAAMRDAQRGRRGLIRSELLESTAEPGSFAVLTHWESMGDFVAWQREPGHDADTAPMDAFLDLGRAGGKYAQAFTVTDEG